MPTDSDQLPSKNLELIKGDSRRIDEIFSCVKKNDIIVHLAELVGDPLCEKRPSKTYEINYLASNSCVTFSVLGVQSSLNLYIISCQIRV